MTFFVDLQCLYLSLLRPANLSTELRKSQRNERRARDDCPVLFPDSLTDSTLAVRPTRLCIPTNYWRAGSPDVPQTAGAAAPVVS